MIPIGLYGSIFVAGYTVVDHRRRKKARPLLDAREGIEQQMAQLLTRDFVIELGRQTLENTPTLNQLHWMIEALESSDPGCALISELHEHSSRIEARVEHLRKAPTRDTDPGLYVDMAALSVRMEQLG